MTQDPLLIMLADDDEGDRLLFKEAFSEIQLVTNILTVNNGIQLMEWLQKSDKPLPFILFLDLNMQPKNGLECLKEIRSNDKLTQLFIAIYSTSDNEKDMDETFQHGANLYIIKPDNYNNLIQLLQHAVIYTTNNRLNKVKREHFVLKF